MPERDAAIYQKRATKCRFLARFLDKRTAQTLTYMADDYDAKARELDERDNQPG